MSQERIFVITEQRTHRDRLLAAFNISREMLKSGPVDVIVRMRKSKRSLDQNKRYWTLLREVSATVWIAGKRFSDECWHEQFKRWFIGMEEIQMPDGQVEQRGMSTTTLSVGDFTDYMRQIESWCADQGFPVMQEAA